MNPANYSTIAFPSLGIQVNPPRALELGSFSFYYYGLIIAVGLILAVLYGCKRSKDFGLKEDDILDGVIWVTPFAILCARAYYVIFSWADYASNPISALYIWEGGLAIYGGVLGAILGVTIFCRYKKIRLATMLDVVLLGFLIGQSIGRWGNFFNREAFGAETTGFLRMCLYNTATNGWEAYHPTFLYESLWNLAGFALLHFASKRRKYDGQIALGYAAWYGLGRCIIETLRMDSLYWGPFRVSQLLAAVTCLSAVCVLLWQWLRNPDSAGLYVNQMAAKAEEAPEAEAEEIQPEAAEEKASEEAEEEEAQEEASAEASDEAAPEAEAETEAAEEAAEEKPSEDAQ